jgi:hypothetical protein
MAVASISFVGESSTVTALQTIPNGVQNGDLMLAFFSYWYPATAVAPNGWTELRSEASGSSGVITVWYRFADNDQPNSTYSWGFSGNVNPYVAGGMLVYRGVDPAVTDGSAVCPNDGSSNAPTLCSITTSSPNDTYVGFFTLESDTFNLPSDLTDRVLTQYNNGHWFGSAAGDKALGTAGTVPPDAGALSNSSGWETIALALKPAGPPVATPMPTATMVPTMVTTVGSTESTNDQVAVPNGVESGDLLLAFFSYWSKVGSVTAPNGWTELHSSVSPGSGVETVWYKFAGASDVPGTTYTWAFTGQGPYAAGGMLAYRGVDPATPFDGSCLNDGSSASPNWCSFSTAYSNDEYVALIATENTNLMFPGDLTSEVLEQYFNGQYFGVGAAEKTLGAAGVVAADTGSMNSGGWATIAMALKPASSGPPIATPMPTATTVPPPMISFVNSTQTTNATQTAPAGLEVGDLMLAFYSYWYKVTSVTAPAGWAQLYSEPSSSSGVETVWYKFATAGDIGNNYTWVFSGAVPYEAGGIVAYRNVASMSMMPVVDGNSLTNGTGTNPTLGGFSNSTANDIYVGFYCTENTGLVTPGDVTTRIIQQYVNGSYFGVAAVDKQLPSTGPNPPDAGTMNSGGWETLVLALEPQ